MAINRDKFWRSAKDYLFITVGMALYSFGLTAFILPEKVVIGGVAGLGSLVYFTTGVPVAITNLVVNIILLIIAYRIVGKKFVIGTLFGVAMCSLFVGIFQPIFQNGFTNEPFMNIVIGASIIGFGVGLTFIHNGSSGGTDIVAAVVTKKSNVSVGRVMLYVDVCIISSSYFIFHNPEKIVYGFVTLVLYTYVADMVINTNRQAVQFTIFSSKWQEIADAVTRQAHRGCTILEGEGWYSHKEVKMVMVFCRKIESVTIFHIIKSIDNDAFISQTNVNGVYGKGFDQMKLKEKKHRHHKEGMPDKYGPEAAALASHSEGSKEK